MDQSGQNVSFFSKRWFEPLLLFAILYLPGYLTQTAEFDRAMFDSLSFNLLYIIMTVPQIALIIYLIWKRDPDSLPRYGCLAFQASDIPWSLLILACIFCAIMPFMILVRSLIPRETGLIPVPSWYLSRAELLPLIFVSCILIGYSEELFFRAYLLTALETSALRRSYAVSATVLLFGAGHLYQGLESFFGTVLIGIILALFFLKHRSIHRIAIAHGLYNFLVLLLNFFITANS